MEQEILQKILALLTEQDARLKALQQENARLTQRLDGIASLCAAIPAGLRPPLRQGTLGDHWDAINRDVQGAFYPPQSHLLLDASYLRYWQLLDLDLSGKRIGMLTTSNAEYPDVLETTRAAECVEIRLHSVNGPFTLISVGQSGERVAKDYPGGLESALLPLEGCDLLWIPDPFLTSLFLRCQGQLLRICERAESFLFSFRTSDWKEDAVRFQLHACGFTEIRRTPESDETAYVTRWDQTKGIYVFTPQRSTEKDNAPPIRLLLATKVRSASFHLVSRSEEKMV
ncbi:hypothetical protein FACS1894158_14020 [Betaproteobacteria bacterium]|nr:hypothetical protein FACS1894158_14020 [Betaproteobacteria bacterium]